VLHGRDVEKRPVDDFPNRINRLRRRGAAGRSQAVNAEQEPATKERFGLRIELLIQTLLIFNVAASVSTRLARKLNRRGR
jgi:hypothetical protein